MHSFEFATATRIVFGQGKIRETGPLVRALGRHALVVTGRDAERAAPLLASLAQAQVAVTGLAVAGEPTLATARAGTERARAAGCDLVIGLGGGSALDTAKAIAALLANGGDPLDYVEVIGAGRPLAKPSVPLMAIPTTAGTGTEVTRNAVLGSPEHKVKVSLRGAGMLPQVALIDPELTYELPPAITAATGLDALTQLIEPFVSNRANPLVDALCRDAIPRAAKALPKVFQNGADAEARTDMALASLFGGLALANAGLGAVHGLAAPIGGMFAAPHGAVCAALLPQVMEINIRALEQRDMGNPALYRYFELARLLNQAPGLKMSDGVRWVRDTVAALQIPPLRQYGITSAAFPSLATQAAKASSMKANPIPLTAAELTEILERAL